MKHKETTMYLVIVFCFLVLYVQIKMKSSQGNYSMVSCKTEWRLKSEGGDNGKMQIVSGLKL